MVKIEARAYGPSSTPAEIEAIKGRVYVHSGDIVMQREMPVQSIFHLDLFEAQFNELASKKPFYLLLIDLTEAEFPSATIRAKLQSIYTGQKNLRRIAAFTGKSVIINTAAKFVLGGAVGKTFSVHKHLEEAVRALNLSA